MHNIDVAITLLFCLGMAWGAFRILVWLIYGRAPSPLMFGGWCYAKHIYCNANKCPCWDEEQEKRKADIERQRIVHENHSRHHA